jgi:hypothetical protein
MACFWKKAGDKVAAAPNADKRIKKSRLDIFPALNRISNSLSPNIFPLLSFVMGWLK